MNPSEEPGRYTVTAALPYANGPLHIGHLAGCYLPADIYVRFLRRRGADVVFICGSDEHGVPITLRAEQENLTPQKVVDLYHALLEETFQTMGISFDYYHRTSTPLHHRVAQDFFKTLLNKGELEVRLTEEFFDPAVGRFLADRYITGICPSCSFDQAYGDQCEKCGRSLSPRELLEPRSRLSGAVPELRPTRHWYLDLGRHQDAWLKAWIEEQATRWKSNVIGQCLSWLGEGENHLRPRAVTRDLDWGVPVPPEIPESQGKVLYVWFEAPLGYISATEAFFQRLAEAPHKRPSWVRGQRWEDYWKKEGGSRIVHFIGKDNIVFHCIVFPAMLKAAGDFQLPWQVPANEFLNLEGQKISTSRNYAVWVHEYLKDLPERVDELRYVLTAGMPEQKDNNFIWKYEGTDATTDSYQARVNNELVANLGNFIHRVVMLIHKFFDGKIPSPSKTDPERHEMVIHAFSDITQALEQFRFRDALGNLMKLSSWGNRYLQKEEPWKTFKTEPERAACALYESAQLAAALGYLFEPFMPGTSVRIRTMLGIQAESWHWNDATAAQLVGPGTPLPAPHILFKKVEDEEIEHQIKKLSLAVNGAFSEIPSDNSQDTPPPQITLEDFKKLRLVVARVIHAEKVPKADKLLQLTLEAGGRRHTVLSGIASHYRPDQVVGRRVVWLSNLTPRRMRGILSEGMILMADGPDGRPIFLEPSEEVEPGSSVH